MISNINQLIVESELQQPGVAGRVNAATYVREALLAEAKTVLLPDTYLLTSSCRADMYNQERFLECGVYVSVNIHRGEYNDALGGNAYVIEPVVCEFCINGKVHTLANNDYSKAISRCIQFGVDDGLTDLGLLANQALLDIYTVITKVQSESSEKSYNLIVVDCLTDNYVNRNFKKEVINIAPELVATPVVIINDDVTPAKLAESLEIHGVKSDLLSSLYDDNKTLFEYLNRQLSKGLYACGEFDKSAFPYSKEQSQWLVFNEYGLKPLMLTFNVDMFKFYNANDKKNLFLPVLAIYDYIHSLSNADEQVNELLNYFTQKIVTTLGENAIWYEFCDNL